MELKLSLPELEAILEAIRKQEHRNRKFAAALKGINLDGEEQTEQPTFEEIERKARATLAGISEEQTFLFDVGMGFEIEEE